MNVAFSIWQERIAPVFDTAPHFLVAQTHGAELRGQSRETFAGNSTQELLEWLNARSVDVVVCGAISNYLARQLERADIQVISFIAGDLPAVIDGWLKQTLREADFAMPGCCGRRRRRRLCNRQ